METVSFRCVCVFFFSFKKYTYCEADKDIIKYTPNPHLLRYFTLRYVTFPTRFVNLCVYNYHKGNTFLLIVHCKSMTSKLLITVVSLISNFGIWNTKKLTFLTTFLRTSMRMQIIKIDNPCICSLNLRIREFANNFRVL